MKHDSECLLVLDSRTGMSYKVPIENSAIQASDICKIVAPVDNDVDSGNESSSPTPQSIERLRILDQGFAHTACMTSSITDVDAELGQLRFRGHAMEDLIQDYVYEDVMHLLIWGEFPTSAQKMHAREIMGRAAIPPQSVVDIITAFPRDSETYHMLLAGMSAFASTDSIICGNRHKQKPTFHGNLGEADHAILRTIGYLSTTVALVYCHKRGKTFTQPRPGLSLISNFLLMMGFHSPNREEPNPKIEGFLNKLWIIFCDFEMCHSTAAVLHAGSSLTDPVSCVISGIVSAHGPLHFGAVELSFEALEQIGSPANVDGFIDSVKNKKSRLFGYGHRTFKTRDPRPALIKQVMGDYMSVNSGPALLQTAFALDGAAQTDPYFVKRNLHVNVDLYASFPYLAMGFEKDIITAVTYLSRIGGALAHWRETLEQPMKLWRPRQIYLGKSYERVMKPFQ